MSKVITAIFENGVFKPLEKVDVKEHQRVEIKIHKKASKYTYEEIEPDIPQAINEVREEKRDR